MSTQSPKTNTVKASTLVVTNTDALSGVADALLKLMGPEVRKNTVLNILAGGLSGGRKNWGGIKAVGEIHIDPSLSRDQQEVLAARFAASEGSDPAAPSFVHVSESPDQSGLVIAFFDPFATKEITVQFGPAECLALHFWLTRAWGEHTPRLTQLGRVSFERIGKELALSLKVDNGMTLVRDVDPEEIIRLIGAMLHEIKKTLLTSDQGKAALAAYELIQHPSIDVSQGLQPKVLLQAMLVNDFVTEDHVAKIGEAVLTFFIMACIDDSGAHRIKSAQRLEIIDRIIDHYPDLLKTDNED